MLPCAKNILESGHQILGIITTDKSLTAPLTGQIDRWADSHQIPILQPTADIFSFLASRPFDYLFSLSNSRIISREILALPRQFAINCHDGPLPKYGGLNAPAWAIFHQERVHGITWHQIAELVDGGDLLEQVFFEIEANETAATLNSKCYEAIIASFPALIAKLASGKLAPVPQNLQQRTYFLGSQKPSPGCIIDWQQSAQAIDATIRALSFDRQENSIGSPKIAIGDRVAIVKQVEISSERSTLPPGTIVAITADRLQVSTTSYDLLVRQLHTLDGQPLDLSVLARQIGDTRSLQISPQQARQIDRLETSLAKHERFWVQRLATPSPLVLPDCATDRGSCQFQQVPISPQLTAFLTDRQPTWQVADFLVVAIATYLGRIAQQDCFDLEIEFAQSDCHRAGLPDLFATHVPCRIDLSQSQRFEAAFETIVRELKLVEHHQTYARDIVFRYPELSALSSTRMAARVPIRIVRVESLATYEYVPDRHPALGLTFVIPDRGDSWHCDGNAGSGAERQQLLSRLAVFIDGVINNLDRSISQMPILPATEIERLTIEWNATQVDFGAEQCIHQLFEAQSAQTPDRIAVEYGREQLTYRELNRRADRLADRLIDLGVCADTLVGICVERSLETIVGILGILKAGGAYVPLDPAYPQARLALIMADAAMPIVLTQSRLVTKLPAYPGQVVCIDEPERQPNYRSRRRIADVQPHHLAYVIYTSGSTGTPKGVAIEHHSVVNYTLAARREYQITSADRILQFTSLNFDVSAEEIYTCLSVGATLVLRNATTSESIETFLHQCREWQITVTSLPTAFWHELTARLTIERISLPPSWRLAIIGGEKAAPAKIEAWIALGTKVRTIDAYGPTEATISALMCDLSTLDPHCPSDISIGRPIANVQAYVLDKRLELCPIGSPGELYLGGAGLARGYLNHPELTAQKFIPNPFDPARSPRLYRTGDLVRYLPNGQLQFLDRLDEQVKIRGFRIELGEIATVLDRHPGIQEAIVLSTGDRHQSLAAYIVPKQRPQQMQWRLSQGESARYITEPQLTTTSIRAYLCRYLPEQMIPTSIVTIPVLPLTPNGKVDRQALLTLNPAKSIATGMAPRNQIEAILLDIWQEILEIETIDLHDNFFELGGHSLLAIQLFTKIQQKLKVQLPLAILVRSPTVAQLAAQIAQSSPAHVSASLVPIQLQGSMAPFFCVHSLDPCLVFYQSLVKYLGTERPFYGIQPYDFKNNLLSFTTIEEIASYYLQEIRSVQPHGPYYLGGFSFGGYIVFEMAQQLRNQGEKVALLTIFDTPALGVDYRVSIAAQLKNMWRIFGKYGNKFIYDKIKNQVTLYRQRSGYLWQKFRAFTRVDLVKKVTVAQQQRHQAFIMNERALERYQPQLYPGEITLFTAGYSVSAIDLAAGWQHLAKMGVKTIEIPGDHASIFAESNAGFLANELTKCMAATVTESKIEQQHTTLLHPQVQPREKVLYPI